MTTLFEGISTVHETLILCFREYVDYKEICFVFKWQVNLSATHVGCNLQIFFEEVKFADVL